MTDEPETTRGDLSGSDDGPGAQGKDPWASSVDHVLGQASAEEQAEHQRALELDPALLMATAEVRDLLERCRELTVAAPAEVGLPQRMLQLELQQRHLLRRPHPWDRRAPARWMPRWMEWAATAAVAAALLAGMLLWQRGGGSKAGGPAGPGAGPHSGSGTAPWVAQGGGAGLPSRQGHPFSPGGQGLSGMDLAPGGELVASLDGVRPMDGPIPGAGDTGEQLVGDQLSGEMGEVQDPYIHWIDAHNEMARMRALYENRRDSSWRRDVISRSGGNPDMEWRVRALARSVAIQVRQVVARGSSDAEFRVPEIRELALALRGLTAAGHGPGFGEHGGEAVVCLEALRKALLDDAQARDTWAADGRDRTVLGQVLDGDDRTMVLAALAEVAALRGGDLARVMQAELTALCGDVLGGPETPVPGVLHSSTSTASLGEAGRLFAMAPALGVDPELAAKARKATGVWLAQEADMGRRSGPGALAAMLYGFADLVDRREVESQLKLYQPRWFLPDYTALHHLAWSRFPAQEGFADMQLFLRQVSGFATPVEMGDQGSLLLCLAANFAAPGAAPL